MSKYKSRIMESVHRTAGDLSRAGLIAPETMKEFDAACLSLVEDLTASEVRELRLRENVSQGVFASYLNVTPGLVSQWERGEKKPSGPSLKLLALVKKNGLKSIA